MRRRMSSLSMTECTKHDRRGRAGRGVAGRGGTEREREDRERERGTVRGLGISGIVAVALIGVWPSRH